MTTSAVPTSPPTGRVATGPAIAMFGLLLLAYSMNAMDRMVFPILLPDVRAEYGFSLDQSVLSDIAGPASGTLILIICIHVAAGVSGYLFSRIVGVFGWVGAGLVQIVGLSVVGALLAAFLRPALFSTTAPRARSEKS